MPEVNLTTEVASVSTIPEITRRRAQTSTLFESLDPKVKALKSGQALAFDVPRTKKNELNRQFAVKLSQHYKKGGYTVATRSVNGELRCYIFQTPKEKAS